MKKTINIYGDTLVEINSKNVLDAFLCEIHNDNSTPYIIHFTSENIFEIPNFVFITHRNGINVYANEIVIKKCPKLINERVSGSTVVLQVKYEDIVYNVFVKDRMLKFIQSLFAHY